MEGSDKTFTITPASGYLVSSVLVDSQPVGQVTSYTFPSVSANHTISASFARVSYQIVSTAGTNGAIEPNGTTIIAFGGTRNYTISPADGFRVNDLLVDSVSQGALTTYQFANVQADHTISASFTENVYNITVTGSGPGTITPSGILQVLPGSDLTLQFVPSNGYKIILITVDESSVVLDSSYTFTNIQASHTIVVTFGTPSNGGSGSNGGGGGGGGYSAPVTTTAVPTTNVSGTDVLKSGTGTSSDTSGSDATNTTNGSVTTIPTTQLTATEVTTVATTSPPVVTTPPSGPVPIWSKVPMNLLLPIIIIVIIVVIGVVGYYLYSRRKVQDQFFDKK